MTAASVTDVPTALIEADEAAHLAGMATRTWNLKVANGTIPPEVQHPITFGQSRGRKYIRSKVIAYLNGEDL